MSFALTIEQVRNRTKTVTRRLGWRFLKRDDLIRAVDKCLGLKKGQSPELLALIRVVDVRREPLDKLMDIPTYGRDELIKEGFDPNKWAPSHFVAFFAHHNKIGYSEIITRIEFEYMEEEG